MELNRVPSQLNITGQNTGPALPDEANAGDVFIVVINCTQLPLPLSLDRRVEVASST